MIRGAAHLLLPLELGLSLELLRLRFCLLALDNLDYVVSVRDSRKWMRGGRTGVDELILHGRILRHAQLLRDSSLGEDVVAESVHP